MVDGIVLFLSLLSVLALVGAILLVAVAFGGRFVGALIGVRRVLVRDFGDSAIPLAATVASIATLGSLFLSEVAGFVPCRLCWVQRGFMYPLAVFLVVAAIFRYSSAWKVALPWSILGGLVSLFHYGEQRHWIGGSGPLCDVTSPCTDIWVWQFGFISIPFMALAGFAFVAALMGLQAARSSIVEPQRESIRS